MSEASVSSGSQERKGAARRARRCAGVLLALVVSAASCARDGSDVNGPNSWNGAADSPFAIRDENARPGDSAWYTTALANQSDLSMWAAPYVVDPGDSVDLFLSGRPGNVNLELFRLGWYGGVGGRRILSIGRVPVATQPSCSAPFPGPVTCPWPVTTRFPVPDSAVSGIYLIKATDSTGKAALYPFVVRSKSRATFTAVVPQLSWQAYNTYGGSSFYTRSPAGTLGHLVSFERPYGFRGGAGYVYGAGYSNDVSVLLWLERGGFDVAYVSDTDVPRLGTSLAPPAKGLLFIGHSEYWTLDEFDAVRRLRDAGVHLAFFAGNSGYWRVRTAPGSVTAGSAQVVECYKSDPDPGAATRADRTTLFRNLGRPENALVGSGYVQHSYGGPYRMVAADSGHRYSAVSAIMGAAGVSSGDTLSGVIDRRTGDWPPDASIEGNEILQNGATPTDLEILFRLPYTKGVTTADGVFEATFYQAASGAGVFSSGINEWGRFLSGRFGPEDPKIAAVTEGVMAWMSLH